MPTRQRISASSSGETMKRVELCQLNGRRLRPLIVTAIAVTAAVFGAATGSTQHQTLTDDPAVMQEASVERVDKSGKDPRATAASSQQAAAPSPIGAEVAS